MADYQQDPPSSTIYTDYPMRFVLIRGLDGGTHAAAINWCHDQFGPAWDAFAVNRDAVWLIGLASISFRDATAATAFKMRWC